MSIPLFYICETIPSVSAVQNSNSKNQMPIKLKYTEATEGCFGIIFVCLNRPYRSPQDQFPVDNV